MDSLLFSLGATLPIFLVMLVGYFLKRLGMMKPDFTASLNKLNYKVTLPVLLLGHPVCFVLFFGNAFLHHGDMVCQRYRPSQKRDLRRTCSG